MMREVEIGKIWLPDGVVSAVERHRESMMEAHKENKETYDMLQRAPFGVWFGDYIYKFGYRMEDGTEKEEQDV